MRGSFIEFTEYETPDGEIYKFDGASRFLLTETGMGMPQISYITQRGPFQHGETYLGFRLEPRIVQMTYRVNNCSRDQYWQARSTLLDMIRPNRQSLGSFEPGILRKTLSDGSIREMKVFLLEGPRFEPRNLDQWDEWGIQETLRWVAPDPTMYDPEEQSVSAGVQTNEHIIFFGAEGVSFNDITFAGKHATSSQRGMLFGEGVIETQLSCTVSGNWIVYPTIKIDGPLSGINITNNTNGEKIGINYRVSKGDSITISLEYGNKSVVLDKESLNLLPYITDDSTLATFHLSPHPVAENGINSIFVAGVNANESDSKITVSWNNRYIGI
jgi:hypothetical protein